MQKRLESLYDEIDLANKSLEDKLIQIYPKPQPDGRILKSIELNIPVYLNGQETRYLFL